MNVFQQAELFFTLLFLGDKASFTFHAGKHVYSVSMGYTSEHNHLTAKMILNSIEGFFASGMSMPFSSTVGNTQVTISLVS